ncbi:MAG: thymidylate synthase [Anaerolineaceae bacterium]
MTDNVPIVKGATLKELLAEAHDYVVSHGVKRESSRGTTFSVKALTLLWESPSNSDENYWGWPRESADFYQRIFVDGRPENRPERLADNGDYLFPYTYAARSRFWDGGWGYIQAVLRATQKIGDDSKAITQNQDVFIDYLSKAGELVHLQVILAVWDWLGSHQMSAFLENPFQVDSFLARSRVDQLKRIINEISDNPASRRAVTVSFVYPELDQRMKPLLGIPPYQFFQLLPGEAQEPLHSFHVHRSLDAGQGVLLDFMHDYNWLAEAAASANRPLGTITVTAGDFHVYLPSEAAPAVDRIEKWLMDVTDGYQAGIGIPTKLLQKEKYLHNAQRIYSQLGDTQ